MRHRDGIRPRIAVLLLVALLVTSATAEQGVLVLVITDTGQHPFANVRVGAAGDGGSPQFTDENGKARLKLAQNTKPADWVTLLILGAPGGTDLVMISPYDGRVRVPPFDNEQDNYDPVVVVKRGDRAMLESGSGMLALHATVNHTVAAKKGTTKSHRKASRNHGGDWATGVPHFETVAWRPAAEDSSPSNDELQQGGIAAAAQRFGLTAADIKAAIADWGGTPLLWKTILLTGTIEAGGTDPFPLVVATGGDLYFSIGFWNLRQCSLQSVLLDFQKADPQRFAEIMGPDTEWVSKTMSAPCEVSSKAALERMLEAGKIRPVWRDRLRQLGREPAFQRMGVQRMMFWMQQAQSLTSQMGLSSEQAVALSYDVAIEAGANTIRRQKQNLLSDSTAFQQQIGRAPDEQEKLLMLGNRLIQARQAGPFPQFSPKFIARAKLFSQGEGVVDGNQYHLQQFGIQFRDPQTGTDIPLHNDPVILAKLENGWIPTEPTGSTPVTLNPPAPGKSPPENSPTEPPGAGPAKLSPGAPPPPPEKPGVPENQPTGQPATPGAPTTPPDGKSFVTDAPAGHTPTPSPSAVPAASSAQCDASTERQFADLMNQERTQRGIAPLQLENQLSQAARRHTGLMVEHNALSHQFPGEAALADRYSDFNLRAKLDGENVGKGNSVANTHSELMASPHHRAAILNPSFTTVGVGAMCSHGVMYVTEDFAQLQESYSNDEAVDLAQKGLAKYAAQKGLSLPAARPDPQLQQMTCDMAQNNALNLAAAQSLPDVRNALGWSTTDPSLVPSGAAEAASKSPGGYSLAVCYAPTTIASQGVYWVVMVVR